MLRTHPIIVLLCLALVTAFPGSTAAQDTTITVQSLIDDGKTLFGEGQYEEALDRFEQAFARSGVKALLYVIGRCHEELGAIGKAEVTFKTLANDPDAPEAPKLKAREALAGLLDKHRTGKLFVEGSPTGAQVLIDGIDRGTLPFGPMELDAGSHRILVKADGYVEMEQSTKIRERQTTRLQVSLTALPKAASSKSPVRPSETGTILDSQAPRPRNWVEKLDTYSPWYYVAGGTGAALLIGGGIVYGLGLSDYDRVESDKTGETLTQKEADAIVASGTTKTQAGAVMMGLGAGGLVAAGVLMYLDLTEPGPDGVSVQLQPTPGGGVLLFQGSL